MNCNFTSDFTTDEFTSENCTIITLFYTLTKSFYFLIYTNYLS